MDEQYEPTMPDYEDHSDQDGRLDSEAYCDALDAKYGDYDE